MELKIPENWDAWISEDEFFLHQGETHNLFVYVEPVNAKLGSEVKINVTAISQNDSSKLDWIELTARIPAPDLIISNISLFVNGKEGNEIGEGEHLIIVMADIDGKIDELNEKNNYNSMRIKIFNTKPNSIEKKLLIIINWRRR